MVEGRRDLPKNEFSDGILVSIFFLFDNFDQIAFDWFSFSWVDGENDSSSQISTKIIIFIPKRKLVETYRRSHGAIVWTAWV